jgi:glutamate-1-semialdehyde aminotransferase
MRLKSPDSSWLNRANQVIAQGSLTNSKRPAAYVKGVFPSHVNHGEGCYIWDAWGNRYLDFIGGLGTNILGYGHPKIAEAVTKYLNHGPSLSLPTVLEVELAERLTDLTGFPKVRFYKTGTEACMAAVRMARASTGDTWLYTNGYHGWSNEFVALMKPGLGTIPAVETSDDLEDQLISIIEPLMLDVIKDKESCRLLDGVVIYDEIITGFRVPQNFVYKWWDCKPDILCLGKAMANGYPLAAVFMEDEYAEPEWFCSGTYCGELMSLAACNATLDELAKKKIDDLYFYSNRFMNNLNKLLADIDVKIQGYGTRGFLPLESLNEALFLQEMAKAGILMGKAFFYGYAHLEASTDESTLNLVSDIVPKIKSGQVKLEGEMPRSSFKRY